MTTRCRVTRSVSREERMLDGERTHETNVTHGDEQRHAGDTDKTEFPGEDKTNDASCCQSGESLHDTAQRMSMST